MLTALCTVPHIFWHCSYVKKLWYDEKLLFNFNLHFESVVLFYQDNMNNEAFVINLFIS